jgi:ribonucleoside-diphosphate reductase alpha chain
LIKKVIKRNGLIVDFEHEKITNAIWKALRVTGEKNRSVAIDISKNVANKLSENFSEEHPPSIEQIQDTVETVLMGSNYIKTAKSYILYRQRRSELRKEKKIILEKSEIDEVDKKFDINSLRVLKSRYLRKDENGKLIETPKELFTRVATHVSIPNIFYHPDIYNKNGGEKIHDDAIINEAESENVFSIGKYKLNRYHIRGLKKVYNNLNKKGMLKVDWNSLLTLMRTRHFDDLERDTTKFLDIMVNRKFFPNTPAIANFGSLLGMGSACFVLGVEDSMEGIMDSLKSAAIIFKSGGGVGYNFSNLRPDGDFVRTTCGVASGPLTFMKMFDVMTEVVKQGGIRRGANMGIMNIDHPDIEKFIKSKTGNKLLTNFNISILIKPDFWRHYNENKPYPLRSPRTGDVMREVDPRVLFDMLLYQAWESAEPGILFYDHINRNNPFLESLGPIQCTNPCGEVLLYPNESCNLGSVNVLTFIKEDDHGKQFFDWEDLGRTVQIGVKFLDNIIDVNNFPLPEIEEMSKNTRKVGLGLMGVGDLLFELKIRYDSPEGLQFMEKLMEFINYHSKIASIKLAKIRGSFPYYEKSFFKDGRMPFSGFYEKQNWTQDWETVSEQIKTNGLRNSYTTVIAPTGSISMIAGASSGMEPVYSLVFEKNVKVGSFYYVDPVFEKVMRSLGLYDEQLMRDVCDHGGRIQNIRYIPENVKKTFITAMDIQPEYHIRALAAFQKWTDSSISKTTNFHADATMEDMKKCYILAYTLGCKGVTVYRDGSIKGQVLVSPKKKGELQKPTTQNQNFEKIPLPENIPSITTITEKTPHAVIPIIPTQPISSIPESKVSTATIPSPPTSTPFLNSDGGQVIDDKIKAIPNTKAEFIDCPKCESKLAKIEGCVLCRDCGWGLCA